MAAVMMTSAATCSCTCSNMPSTGALATHGGSTPGAIIIASSTSSTSRLIAVNRERLEAGLSYLQLPQHVAAAARQLLASVIEAKRRSDPPRPTTPVTLAATLYLAAREQGYALSLGAAGAAFSTNPIHVSREFRWGSSSSSSSSSSSRVPPTLPPKPCLAGF